MYLYMDTCMTQFSTVRGLSCSVQNSSGAHQASYSKHTVDLAPSPGVNEQPYVPLLTDYLHGYFVIQRVHTHN
jgi:hypothetical protein